MFAMLGYIHAMADAGAVQGLYCQPQGRGYRLSIRPFVAPKVRLSSDSDHGLYEVAEYGVAAHWAYKKGALACRQRISHRDELD